ncbi:MAG: beta-ketoacyl-ACP synthase II [Planctomycetota bacterium]
MGDFRVVVTGLGVVTPLSCEVKDFWSRLLKGESGIDYIKAFDTSKFEVKFAGEVRNFEPQKYINERNLKKIDRVSQFSLYAAKAALEDAQLNLDEYREKDKVGIILGSGIGGMWEFENQHIRYLEKGPERVSPFFVPKLMMNANSANIAIEYGITGPNFMIASACASGNHAIGVAFDYVRRGTIDVCITGGSEAAVTPMGLAGFSALKALSKRNDAPKKASRPFDRDRDGFVLSEGAAIVILEKLEHAKKRGAKIYAEIVGFAMNCDAFHITAPEESGLGAYKCMQSALDSAKIPPDKINYINTHGTSTQLNDITETKAIKNLFKEHSKNLSLNSTKSMIGHSLGAAAAIEFVVTVLSCYHNLVHPTINLENPDPQCDLDYTPLYAKEKYIEYAMSNAFGFGGHNATIVIKKFTE